MKVAVKKIALAERRNALDGTRNTCPRPVESAPIWSAVDAQTRLRDGMTPSRLVDPVSFVFLVLGAAVLVVGFAVLVLW